MESEVIILSLGHGLAELLEVALRYVDFHPTTGAQLKAETVFVARCNEAIKEWRDFT